MNTILKHVDSSGLKALSDNILASYSYGAHQNCDGRIQYTAS